MQIKISSFQKLKPSWIRGFKIGLFFYYVMSFRFLYIIHFNDLDDVNNF